MEELNKCMVKQLKPAENIDEKIGNSNLTKMVISLYNRLVDNHNELLSFVNEIAVIVGEDGELEEDSNSKK